MASFCQIFLPNISTKYSQSADLTQETIDAMPKTALEPSSRKRLSSLSPVSIFHDFFQMHSIFPPGRSGQRDYIHGY